MTEDTTTQCLLFPEIFPKPVVTQFDQVQGSSDGGAILLKAADLRLGLLVNFGAARIKDGLTRIVNNLPE